MTKFLLTGTYNSCNKGDAAMELAARDLLRSRFPDAEIAICSPFPELDRDIYAPDPVVACTRRRLIAASLALFGAFAWRLARATTGKDLGWLLPFDDLKQTRSCDLVIDLSGDMQTENSGVHVAYSHFLPLLRALVLGKPYLLCAQSIGPFRLTRPLARMLLARAAAITVREKISEDYLGALGLAGDKVQRTCDLAFLLEPASAQRGQTILDQEGVAPASSLLVGVSVSQLVEARYRQLNPLAAQTDFVELMAALIDRLVEVRGAEVLLVPHVTGPAAGKDDRRIGQRVLERVTHRKAVHALRGDYDPKELKAIIGRCTAFVGARMHANIAALSSGIPTVAIAYSHKTHGIMRACGQEALVLDIARLELSELYRAISKALNEQATIAAQLTDRLSSLRRAARANLEAVERLLRTKEDSANEHPLRRHAAAEQRASGS